MGPFIPHSAFRIPHSGACRVCGHDLRGAVDDVVRCPRCKAFQVRSLPDDPAYRLVGRHRWVRFLPYLCVFLFWFAVVVTFRVLDRSVGWGAVTGVMTAAAWLAAVAAFRHACEVVPGWVICLAEFHVASGVLLFSAYYGLRAMQRIDTAGWDALLAITPIAALVGGVLALVLSVDALRRSDAMRLQPVRNAECGMRNAE